ncbi:GbsR/MarR family transcriptional regulator [Tundrisphaera sp. TA3]|uniref:GbsR/MarR family transcriptional regulator n=1 Tax=Tundrisphaera sp. TA3 TaxID=3435775 RepID=UPI003EBBBB77
MEDDETIPEPDPPAAAPSGGGEADLVRQFVEHWGVMARSWGINASMGEMFALLYITGEDWTAEDLRDRLQVSRGNVSMNLRELIAWGVVHKVHRQGERREYYRAEGEVWTLFRRILRERKRRELDPTLIVLQRSMALIEGSPGRPVMAERVAALQDFFALINSLAQQLLTIEPEALEVLRGLIEPAKPPG